MIRLLFLYMISTVYSYLAEIADQVERLNEPLQLIIIKFIYEVCHAQPSERGKFIKMVYSLLNSTSPSVKFEAAGVLVTLSQAPAAVRAAAGAYIDLVVRSGDNNVKLIVLDKLISLKVKWMFRKVFLGRL